MNLTTKNMNTEVIDGVLVVTLDLEGEKVNKLCSSLSAEFEQTLKRVDDNDVEAVVIISGKKDNYIAAADIDELSTAQNADEIKTLSQNGQKLLDQLEASKKPVIAAIQTPVWAGFGTCARLPLPNRYPAPENRHGSTRSDARTFTRRWGNPKTASANWHSRRIRHDAHRSEHSSCQG